MGFDLPGLFGAGLLTFVSPCVLPLVPIYLAVLGGASVAQLREGDKRGRLLASAVAFSAGLSVVFIALGMAATAAGHALVEHRALLMQIGGIAMLIAGLKFLGVIQVPYLDVERRPLLARAGQGGGIVGAALLGGAFALGWTPCIGPVLGAIIGLASFDGESARGTMLLGAYSLGLGVPFIAAAMAVDTVTQPLKKARLLRVGVPIVSGVLVAGIGVLMLTNTLVQMPQYFDWGGSPQG